MNFFTNKFGIIDLCCGMGGLSYAAKEVGIPVWAGVDISKYALCSYEANISNAITILSDILKTTDIIKKLAAKIIQENQKQVIIVSGPPCQGFSDAGPRRVEDPRNTILLSVAQVIVKINPIGAIIENVSALNKKRNSAVVESFYHILNSGGYYIYSLELNSFNFGVSQNRNRIIYFILPFQTSKELIIEHLKKFYKPAKTVKECIGNLPIPPLRPIKYDPNRDDGNIPNHFSMRHSIKVRNKIALIKHGEGPLSYRKLEPDSYAPTLLSGHRAPPAHYEQPRSITVREALRLQGFPDSFRVLGTFASQMGQVTNAVPVPLGIAVISVLQKLIGEVK